MIYIGADHGGFDLKTQIIDYFKKNDILFTDLGTNSTESVDYPDFAHAVCKKVLEEKSNLGILICKTGVGMSIAANKVSGIRAALCKDAEVAALCRQHNNANVLCLGARDLDVASAIQIINAFLSAEFEGGRHQKRVDKFE